MKPKLRPAATLVLRVLLLCAVVAGASSCFRRTERLRIAAGTSGSTVYELGTTLADVFNEKVEGVKVGVIESDELRTSVDSIVAGDADLAIAFSDSAGDGDVRTLAPLYELYLYIVVWEDEGLVDIPALKGRSVGVGPAASGTDSLARRLLRHYSFEPEDATLVNGKYRELTQAFSRRELDALMILGSIESEAVERLLALEGTTLLSLDDPARIAPVMDGIRTKQPFVVSHVIPKHLFGNKPTQPSGVIGVNALLVARSDLDDETARRLTEALFQHRVALGARIPRLREISENFDRSHLRFPLHPGAAQYYRRDEPPAILEWADTISLFITVMVLGWSGILALAAGRRRKRKGLLDELYREFQAVAYRSDESTPVSELEESRHRLQELRRKAFESLMEGRVEANSAFVVFHDYLRAELQEIERLRRDAQPDPSGDTSADEPSPADEPS